MGLLDSVVGAALGQLQGGAQQAGGSGGGQADLLGAVLGMLTQGGQGAGAGGLAGLAGLVAQFQKAGLGDVVNSWVGTGQNLPIRPDQLGQALGPDVLSGLSSRLGGAPTSELLGPLAQLLPQLVDTLTPNGQLPQGNPDLGSLLAGLAGGAAGGPGSPGGAGGLGDLAGMLGGLLNRR